MKLIQENYISPIFLGAYNLLLSNIWNNVWSLEAMGTNYKSNTKFGNSKVYTAIHTYQKYFMTFLLQNQTRAAIAAWLEKWRRTQHVVP